MDNASPLELAPISARLAAKFIDVIGGFIFICILSFPLYLIVSNRALGDRVFNLLIVLYVGYLLFADTANGQGIGKRLMGITVIEKESGNRCSFQKVFVRNVVLSFLGPIDCLFALGESKMRLGDRLARTVVVKADSSERKSI
jgi:uncharacterized RDD family membrane protein YckC